MSTQTRTTKQRTVVLEELRKVKTHPTADMVYEMVRRRLPHISLGTVYRNLELLADQGIILKLEVDGNKMRFDGNPKAHSHIKCVKCGRVDDICVHPEIDWNALSIDTGYQLLNHRVQYYGICPDCQEDVQIIEQDFVASQQEEINGN